jgi:diaminopimelate epimerase
MIRKEMYVNSHGKIVIQVIERGGDRSCTVFCASCNNAALVIAAIRLINIKRVVVIKARQAWLGQALHFALWGS